MWRHIIFNPDISVNYHDAYYFHIDFWIRLGELINLSGNKLVFSANLSKLLYRPCDVTIHLTLIISVIIMTLNIFISIFEFV